METCTPPLASLIRDGMARKGYSTTGLAAEIGVSSEHIRKFMKGESIPSNARLRNLCEVLGIPIRDASKCAAAQRIEQGFLREAMRDPGCVALCKLWPNLPPQDRAQVLSNALSACKRAISAAA